MSNHSEKTEKPTEKRLKKAREEGRFAVSRELVGALQFIAAVTMLGSWAPEWFANLQHTLRRMMSTALKGDLSAGDLTQLGIAATQQVFFPIFAAGGILMLVTVGTQFATTRFGFSMGRLAPSWNKLNPAARLKDLPRQNLFAAAQTAATLVLCGFALYTIARRNAEELFLLPVTPLDSGLRQVFHSILELLWKAALVFTVFGCIDFYRQKRKHDSEMRMTKQEIREEFKESEGNPIAKQRIRRLQREMRKRKMLNEVPKATVVVVNPTHYSIAIRYELNSSTAPLVVAKGKGDLALRIRRIATENGIPLVENPPLARALYDAAGINSEIPAHFYRAVAEVLAHVFRAIGMVPQG